ncbi:hypothetical protein Btru_057094 [Bulinus truncatus]|nr:hypothetical protein Btru_057094 [Bulinus truncatus]
MDRDLLSSGFTFLLDHENTPQPYDHKSKVTPSRSSTVQRNLRLEIGVMNEEDIIRDPNLPLVQKLKAHYKKKSSTDTSSRHLFRVLFQFQAITQLYMTLVYLIPQVFSSWDPITQYYLKVFSCYVFAMGQANWLCSICYSNRLPDIRDRPNMEHQEWFKNVSETFGQTRIDIQPRVLDSIGLEWKYCTFCERYKPPRTHHCSLCRCCVLRRDHHCYMIGKCIGHYNQRYFIVLCFWGVITGVIGFYMTVMYLTSLSEAFTFIDYIFPWSLFKFLIGRVSWQFLMLTFHAEMLAVFGTMSFIYGIGQFSLVCMGCTMYEVAKQVEINVSSTMAENIRTVFGDYWALNFLFPAQILFKQRHDGMHYENIKLSARKVSVE